MRSAASRRAAAGNCPFLMPRTVMKHSLDRRLQLNCTYQTPTTGVSGHILSVSH